MPCVCWWRRSLPFTAQPPLPCPPERPASPPAQRTPRSGGPNILAAGTRAATAFLARAILAGDNGDRPRLRFLADNVPLQPGERIVTSGHGGVFPGGLAIGRVARVGRRGAEVESFADFDRLEYVRVLRYQPPRLYEDERGAAGLAARTGPYPEAAFAAVRGAGRESSRGCGRR